MGLSAEQFVVQVVSELTALKQQKSLAVEPIQSNDLSSQFKHPSLAELYSVMTRLPDPLRVFPDEAEAMLVDLVEYVEPVSLIVEDYQVAMSTPTATDGQFAKRLPSHKW